jgi:hypothetical protein
VRTLHVSRDLSLPEDTVTSTLIVFGGKGMGKTNFGAVLVEEMSRAHLRWCVLDPLGVWWGLRHSGDGKGPGIECLILGGIHGDIPIEPTAGSVVADLVVDESVNVVIDFSRKPAGLMWSKAERIRFVTDYAVRLFQRQGELIDGRRRAPLFVVLDEAARYIPQMVRLGDKDIALCVGAWEDLVEEGRNVGIGVGLLTQRSARINKSVSELADAMIAFRTVGPLSVAAIMDWLGDHVPKERIKALVEIIRALDVGSALAVSPGWLRFEDVVRVRPRETFDSSATPKAGERRSTITDNAAMPDLAKYRDRMATTIERVKADDPKELRRRITELEKELRKARSAQPSAEIRTVEVPVEVVLERIPPELKVRIAELETRLAAAVRAVEAAADAARLAREIGQKEPERKSQPRKAESALRPAALISSPSRGGAPVQRTAKPAAAAPDDVHVKAGARRILETFARHYPMRMTRSQLGTLARFKITGGTFLTYFSQLKRLGYLEEAGGEIWITRDGLDYIGEVPTEPMSTEELLEQWRTVLKAGARKMLDELVAVYPALLSRDELAARTDMTVTGGTFMTYLATLRRNGLVEVEEADVRASDTLFVGDRALEAV